MADGAAGGVGTAVGGRVAGWVKGLLGLLIGVGSGAAVTSSSALLDKVIKPTKPLANFAVAADGLNVTCQNHASGDSGWWDFGDGSPLEPFDPAQPAVTHAYPKPGTYSVKLTVRNYVMDENDRAVAVDLSAAAPQALAPAITGLKVDTLNGRAVAPAGFVIRCTAVNTDRVVFDLGGKALTVETAAGPVEKFVVFEEPGPYAIRVLGLNGKQASQQAATVTVEPAAAGSVSAVLRVTDAGTQAVTKSYPATAVVPVPKAGEAKFEKRVAAPFPGFKVTAAKLGAVKSAAVKNVKAAVTPDGQAALVSGDWAGTPEAAAKAAGGSDVLVPVTLTLEGASGPVARSAQVVSGVFGPPSAQGRGVTLTLPPQPPGEAGLTRKMHLSIVEASPAGRVTLATVPDLPAAWQGQTTAGGVKYAVTAGLTNGKLDVRMVPGR